MRDALITTSAEVERVILVGSELKGTRPLLSLQDSLNELSMLAGTAGMAVVGQAHQRLSHIDPNTYIGSGKLDEIREQLTFLDAKVLVFDDELSPRHQRELEKVFGEEIKVLDRSALILDIFAQHARTREGALQVELAQYEYRLPRLTRQWTHLARQAGSAGARGGVGGVGLRGPGETQLEVDRREIARKIAKLKEDLERVRQHRRQHRQQRTRTGVPVIALVGYTNAGKSTLFKALTNTEVYIADQLFATLDPLTRRVNLPSGRVILLTDTVGFIQKLPATLAAAFRATLEETVEADLLLHVVDVSHPNVIQQIEAVEDTLAEIEMPGVPRILVWNKMDKWTSNTLPTRVPDDEYAAEVSVSAQQGAGVARLLSVIEETLSTYTREVELLIPYSRGEIVSQLFEAGSVVTQTHTEHGVRLVIQLPPAQFEKFKSFRINPE